MKKTRIEVSRPMYNVNALPGITNWPFGNAWDSNWTYRDALTFAQTLHTVFLKVGYEDVTAEIMADPAVYEHFVTPITTDAERDLSELTRIKYSAGQIPIIKLPRSNYYYKIGCFIYHLHVASWNYKLIQPTSANPYSQEDEFEDWAEWNRYSRVDYSQQFYGYASRLFHIDGTLIFDGLRFDTLAPVWYSNGPTLAGSNCCYLYEEGDMQLITNGFNPDYTMHEIERFCVLLNQTITPPTVKTYDDLLNEENDINKEKIYRATKDKKFYKWDGSKWIEIESPNGEDAGFDKNYYLLAFNSENHWNTSPVLLYGTDDEYLGNIATNSKTVARSRILAWEHQVAWSENFEKMYDPNEAKTLNVHNPIGDEFLKDDTVFSAYENRRFDTRVTSGPRTFRISGDSRIWRDYSEVVAKYYYDFVTTPFIGDIDSIPGKYYGMIMPLQLKDIDDEERVLFNDLYFGVTNMSLDFLLDNRLIVIDDGLFFYIGGPEASTIDFGYLMSDTPSPPGRHCLFVYLGDMPEEEEPDPTQPEPPKEVNREDVVNLLNNLYDWQFAGSLDGLGSIAIPDPEWELIKVVGLFDDLNIYKVLDRDDISRSGNYSIAGWLDETEYEMTFSANADKVDILHTSGNSLVRKPTYTDIPYRIIRTPDSVAIDGISSGTHYVNGEYYKWAQANAYYGRMAQVNGKYYNQPNIDYPLFPEDEIFVRLYAGEMINGQWTRVQDSTYGYTYKYCLVDEYKTKLPSSIYVSTSGSNPSSDYNLTTRLNTEQNMDCIDCGNFIKLVRITLKNHPSGEGYSYSNLLVYSLTSTITTVDTWDYSKKKNKAAPVMIEVYKTWENPKYIDVEKKETAGAFSVYYINPYLIEEEEP